MQLVLVSMFVTTKENQKKQGRGEIWRKVTEEKSPGNLVARSSTSHLFSTISYYS